MQVFHGSDIKIEEIKFFSMKSKFKPEITFCRKKRNILN